MPTHSEKFRKQLLKKLPVTGTEGQRIFLGRPFLKTLTDTEFIILWNTPKLDIVLGPNAARYVKQRVQDLGLQESPTAGFNIHEKDQRK